MKSFLSEDGDMYGTNIQKIIKAVLLDKFNQKITDDQASEISSKMSLSDVISLDSAIERDDVDKISDILGVGGITSEEIYPGRGNIKSSAYNRPTSTKGVSGNTAQQTSNTSKPVAGGNVVATGQPSSSNQETEPDDVTNAELSKELELLKKRIGQ